MTLDSTTNADPQDEIFELWKDGELCDPFQTNSPDNSEDPPDEIMDLWNTSTLLNPFQNNPLADTDEEVFAIFPVSDNIDYSPLEEYIPEETVVFDNEGETLFEISETVEIKQALEDTAIGTADCCDVLFI